MRVLFIGSNYYQILLFSCVNRTFSSLEVA